jgi:integrase
MAVPKVTLRTVKRKRSKVYQIDYTVNGKRFRTTVGSNKHDAELAQAKLQSDLTLGKFNVATPRKSITLSNLVAGFLRSKKNRVRDHSLTRYRNYYARFEHFFNTYFPAATANVQLIQSAYLEEFVEHVMEPRDDEEKAWAQGTVNDAIRSIRALFTYAVDQEYLEKSPATKLRGVRERGKGNANFFSDEELEKIWTVVDPYWADALKFISETGLRKGELLNLTWDQVDLTPSAEQITVENTDDFETKTGKSRTIPLTQCAVEILRRAKGKHARIVFPSKEGMKAHPDKIYHAIKDALATLGLEGNVHKLRHTYASKLSMNEVNEQDIQNLLGHADRKSTRIYTHRSPDRLREAVRTLEKKPAKPATDGHNGSSTVAKAEP